MVNPLIAVIVVVALAAMALALVLWRRRARRRPRRRPVTTRFPVLLAHGLFGFDQVKLGRRRHEYFKGVPKRLRSSGVDVHLLRVPANASVARRAEELARLIEQVEAKRVNIVAHSMGGLDARYAISRLGVSRKVASLVTVGSPHRGTPLADSATELLGEKLGLKKVCEMLGVDLDAFYDLTTERMAGFNREVEDQRGILYGSVVGRVKGGVTRVNALLVPTYLYLCDRIGENDGFVPAASQRWGEVFAEIDADHWAQIGWSRGFDAPEFYAEVVRELRGRGL